MSAENVTEVFDYHLIVKGVWGRNRSVKVKVIRLARHLRTDPLLDDDQVTTLVRNACAELKLKFGQWKVDRDPAELQVYSDGLTIESHALFSGTTVLTGNVPKEG